jgi:hypothetical protein
MIYPPNVLFLSFIHASSPNPFLSTYIAFYASSDAAPQHIFKRKIHNLTPSNCPLMHVTLSHVAGE